MLKRITLGRRIPAVAGAVIVVAIIGGGTATAANLITGKDIKNGSVGTADIKNGSLKVKDLTPKAVKTLQKHGTATAGATGSVGATGAAGARGPQGPQGPKGDAGENGVNPAVLVAQNGDAGWTLSGSPAAVFAGGELRLAGGFDGSTVAGAIGVAKAFDNLPLSSLSSLSYTMHVVKRPNDNSAPTIHVAVVGAETGTSSGFMNLVFEPINNGGTTVNQPYVFDAVSGSWWGTRATPGHAVQVTDSLASFVQANPNAKIISVSVDNGGSSANTVPVNAFTAGVDNLVLGFGDTFTRYDFGG